MILDQLTVNVFIFLIGLIGIATNFRNILVSLIGIELMLLSASLNMLMFSLYLNDIHGYTAAILILTIAATESAIGLALIIIFFKTTGSLEMTASSFPLKN